MMNHTAVLERQRARLLRGLPDLTDILRGSLLERTIRHRQGCPKCARGEGHPVWVLAIGYPKGVIRHVSLHPEQVPEVRRQLENYHQIKGALERVCEFNQQQLRSGRAKSEPSRRRR
jgi:hypothetical protein